MGGAAYGAGDGSEVIGLFSVLGGRGNWTTNGANGLE
jgi:hypothetical protein